MVAEDQQPAIPRQRAQSVRYLPHRNRLGSGNPANVELEGLAHIDQQHRVGLFVEQAAGFLDGDFKRSGGVGLGDKNGP